MSLPNFGNVFPDDILGRIRDLETAVNELEGGTFAAVVTLAGDVTGPSDTTVVEAIRGYAVSATAPGSGEVLEWDGSAWTPTALSAGSGDLSKNVANTGITTWTSLRTASTAPTWRLERSLGTAGSPTAVTVGFTTGGFTFGGYDGTDWASDAAAGLFGKTSETWSSTAHGMFISLETTETGSTDRLEALRITSRGDLLNVRGFPSLRPDDRFAYQQRGANMLLARASSELVTELYVSDSTGHVGASDPEQTSCISIYESQMARRYNKSDRTVGYLPAQQFNASGPDGIEWDTVQGTNSGRGPGYQAQNLTGSQYCEVTRRGTAVTIYYTAQQTGGGTATVTINGATAGTINSTDGTLGAGAYDSGRSVTYTDTKHGQITVKVQITSGTAFLLEGAYFHNGNNTAGYQLIRADKSGQSFSYINDNPDPLLQSIANIQPDIVTLQLGINDTTVLSGYELTASELVDEFETLVESIRDEYATWTPSIRFFFANQSSWVPDDWSTTYRTALRNACVKNDVLFLDGHDAVGSVDGSDPYDFSDDTFPLHPNDYGHWVWGEKVAAATITGMGLPQVPLSLSSEYTQPVTSANGLIETYNATGVTVRLTRDEGAAVADDRFLGSVNFRGVSDAYGTSRFGSAISGQSEGAFSGTSWSSGLRFWTTNVTTSAIRGGFTAAGTFFIGATAGTATFGVTSAGAVTATGYTGPVLSLDDSYNTVTGTFGAFGANSFGLAPVLTLRRAQGTEGSPTNITSGIVLSGLSFSGYNSDGQYYVGAQVRGASEEAFSTAAYRGSRLEFLTAPTASGTAAVVRALINNAGNFYVGATAAAAKFAVIGSSGNTSVGGTLGVTGNTTLSGTLSVTGHPTLEGVTATGATGTGDLVFATSPTLVTPTLGAATATSLTASAAQAGAVCSVRQGTVTNPVLQLTSTATNDDPTEIVRQFRGTTTQAVATNIGAFTPTVSTQTTVQAIVTARRTGGIAGTADDGAGYVLNATFKIGSAGAVTRLGSTISAIGESQSAWTADIVEASGDIAVQCTGAANNNVTWHATVRSYAVST
jgi:hypothetical protein